MLENLKNQYASYYRGMSIYGTIYENIEFTGTTKGIYEEMEKFYLKNPLAESMTIKSHLHKTMAQGFTPVIFSGSPFYFEMGLRPAENWGQPSGISPACWLMNREVAKIYDNAFMKNLEYFKFNDTGAKFYEGFVFDCDHHCPGYSKILDIGILGIINEIELEIEKNNEEKMVFLRAAKESCEAILLVAEKFSDSARSMVETAENDQQRNCLEQIAITAKKVPANPPETFYEGLAALLFIREVIGTFEGVGVSVIGHPDRQLIDLYKLDIENKVLTEWQARDLLSMWMIFHDIKFNANEIYGPETSTTMELGGCDREGNAIFNDITKMIIQTHEELDLINPKLNCRIAKDSPDEYIELISDSLLRGHNVFALFNDSVLIPACIKSGKSIQDARNYVNGGCQETMVEGVEHSAGSFFHFLLPRIIDLSLQADCNFIDRADIPEAVFEAVPKEITDVDSYEEFYDEIIKNLKASISYIAMCRQKTGEKWNTIHPCPMFSATIEGCISNRKDYTQGGAKHNDSTLSCIGFGTVIDSLYSVKRAVFDEKTITFAQLKTILKNNWDGNEELRRMFISFPKYGHNNADVDSIAARFAVDLSIIIRNTENERGGHYLPSMFSYFSYVGLAGLVKATPDGRFDKDLLSPGASPSRINPPKSITDFANSVSKIDFSDYVTAVIDFQLPVGSKILRSNLSAFIKACVDLKLPTIQINILSPEKLQDAIINPQSNKDIIVRVSGWSARFVSLYPEIQKEIISRMQNF